MFGCRSVVALVVLLFRLGDNLCDALSCVIHLGVLASIARIALVSFVLLGVRLFFSAFSPKLFPACNYLRCLLGAFVQGGQGSGDGLGVLDLDVDMEDVAALKASEICEEGPAEKTKKKNDSHFELTNLKETLQGTLGLRQKKDNSHQQLGGNRSQPPSQHHASSPVTVENSTNSQDKASSNKPQPLSDAAKTD